MQDIRKKFETDGKPTYEIVGELSKPDDRRSDRYYNSLDLNHPDYPGWAAENPDLKEFHLKLLEVKKRRRPVDIYSRSFYAGTQYPWKDWDVPFGEAADLSLLKGGPVALDRVDASMETFTDKVKSFATYLGADLVRIAKLNPNWIFQEPITMFSPYSKTLEHHYAIVISCKPDRRFIAAKDGVLRNTEVARVYSKGLMLNVQLAAFIRSLGYDAHAHLNDSVIHPAVAADAGVGESGRWGNIVSPDYGSMLRIWSVTTDMPLVCDKPIDFGLQDFCKDCGLCAELCPSGAIPTGGQTVKRGVKKWWIDQQKCIYFQERMHGRCQLCHVICPWSDTYPGKLDMLYRKALLQRRTAKVIIDYKRKYSGKLSKKLFSSPEWWTKR